jgi:hypothetical protein
LLMRQHLDAGQVIPGAEHEDPIGRLSQILDDCCAPGQTA